MFEETGVRLKLSQITPIKTVYVRYPDYDFIYHMFSVFLANKPETIVLRPREHKSFDWWTHKEVLELPLIPGAKDTFSHLKK